MKRHKCIPRKTSLDFSSFKLTSMNIPVIPWEVVRENNGKNSNKKLYIVINNKVLEFKGKCWID